MDFEYNSPLCLLSITVKFMGDDLAVLISGGSKPHIGTGVLSIPRPSLTGEGISVTSSVLNRVNHYDEKPARFISEHLAKRLQRTTGCFCGIHIEHASQDQIEAFMDDLANLARDIENRIARIAAINV